MGGDVELIWKMIPAALSIRYAASLFLDGRRRSGSSRYNSEREEEGPQKNAPFESVFKVHIIR